MKELSVDLKGVVCTVRPMTAREDFDVRRETLPLFEDYDHFFTLRRGLERHAPNFDYPRLYAALKCLFGESTTAYDDFKCSFGYPFLVRILRDDTESRYVMSLMDLKGGLTFFFRKVLRSPEEFERFPDLSVLRKPLEEDFSAREMRYLMTWLVFYLVGFMESFEPYYDEEFVRSQDYCSILYGFRDGKFFEERFDNCDDFHAAKLKVSENGEIPFNRVKPNSPDDDSWS